VSSGAAGSGVADSGVATISAGEMKWRESAEALAAVDAIFADGGVQHGRRQALAGTWAGGERVKRVRASQAKSPVRRRAAVPGVVRVPGWEKFAWLHAGFSTRLGGATEVYAGGQPQDLNLGWTRDDDAAIVAENRRRFMREVTGTARGSVVKAFELTTVRQTHSPVVRLIEEDHGTLATAEGHAQLRGDAVMTDVLGILAAVSTADCIPVLLVDPKRRVVAAFHAGWRGTLKRIVERGVGTMQLRYGSQPKDLLAAIGPGIGACCYAVGEDVRHEFESQFAYASQLFSEVYDSDPVREKYPLLFLTARAPGHSNIGPQIHIDLWEANRQQLLDAGLRAKNITVIGECSGCTREKDGRRRYFSHRMEHGFTGRMLSVVGISEAAGEV
jgi:YfiH family protein